MSGLPDRSAAAKHTASSRISPLPNSARTLRGPFAFRLGNELSIPQSRRAVNDGLYVGPDFISSHGGHVTKKRSYKRRDTPPVGARYGQLTVVGFGGYHPTTRHSLWICGCDCGREVLRRAGELTIRASCGKTHKPPKPSPLPRAPRVHSIPPVGQRFHRLTVTGPAETKTREIRWMCRCDCGTEKSFYARNIVRGATKSCGHGRPDASSERMRKRALEQKMKREISVEGCGPDA